MVGSAFADKLASDTREREVTLIVELVDYDLETEIGGRSRGQYKVST